MCIWGFVFVFRSIVVRVIKFYEKWVRNEFRLEIVVYSFDCSIDSLMGKAAKIYLIFYRNRLRNGLRLSYLNYRLFHLSTLRDWFSNIKTILSSTGFSFGLRLTEVRIPNHTVRDSSARLECHFDLDGEALYSVKWYKDGNEFYRYVPRDMPPAQVFILPGVSVDVSITKYIFCFFFVAAFPFCVCKFSKGSVFVTSRHCFYFVFPHFFFIIFLCCQTGSNFIFRCMS